MVCRKLKKSPRPTKVLTEFQINFVWKIVSSSQKTLMTLIEDLAVKPQRWFHSFINISQWVEGEGKILRQSPGAEAHRRPRVLPPQDSQAQENLLRSQVESGQIYLHFSKERYVKVSLADWFPRLNHFPKTLVVHCKKQPGCSRDIFWPEKILRSEV